MIQAEGLTKKFNDFTALDAIHCRIPEGCIYGMVGSNGAGKSTFLRLVTGIYRPDAGSVMIDGEPVYVLTAGMIRGMLQDGVEVSKGMKSGDVDPRGNTVDYRMVSDKATAIGGGVLEAILSYAGDRL